MSDVEEVRLPEVKTLKVNNPLFIGAIGDKIKEYVDRTKVKNVSYESVWTYLTQVCQLGGEAQEFHITYLDDQPAGFIQWGISPLPALGTAMIHHVFKWEKDGRILKDMAQKFVEYALNHNCPYVGGTVIAKGVFKSLQEHGKDHGIEFIDTGFITFLGRKR